MQAEKKKISDWLFAEAMEDENPLRRIGQLAHQDQQAYKLVYSDVTAWDQLKQRVQAELAKRSQNHESDF